MEQGEPVKERGVLVAHDRAVSGGGYGGGQDQGPVSAFGGPWQRGR